MKGKRLIQMMKDISPDFEELYYWRSLQDSINYKLVKNVKGEPVKFDSDGIDSIDNMLNEAIFNWGRKNNQFET